MSGGSGLLVDILAGVGPAARQDTCEDLEGDGCRGESIHGPRGERRQHRYRGRQEPHWLVSVIFHFIAVSVWSLVIPV